MRKLTVALNSPKPIGDFLAYARHVASSMAGNPYFPSPPVPIATLVADIAALDAAEVATKSRTQGTATARNAQRAAVRADLEQERVYVETVASGHAEDAPAVVASSGMSIKQSSGPRKAMFSVKQRATSGSVRLTVRHPGIVASFEWQSSLDGTQWIDAGATVHARLDLDGFTPGVMYFFRYRTLTRDGKSDWSDPITLRVV